MVAGWGKMASQANPPPVKPASHSVLVHVLAIPLPTHLPANGLGKTEEDAPNPWDPTFVWGPWDPPIHVGG